jgi:hypothetical protein
MTLLRLIARQAGAMIRARLREAAVRAIWLGVAAITLLLALICASAAGYLFLATLIAPWYAALCVAGGWLVPTGLGLYLATRRSRVADSDLAGETALATFAEARARGEAMARNVEPEHLVALGLVAGVVAGRKMSSPRDG